MSKQILRQVALNDIKLNNREAVDSDCLTKVIDIVQAVRARGDEALREYGQGFGDIKPAQSMILNKEELDDALKQLSVDDRTLLERTAERVRKFALAQRECIRDLEFPIDGGVAGHKLFPVQVAGCYAPGGRFPLPSSVLMTAVTARVAGVEKVWVASPRPSLHTLAAAAVAGADAFVTIGGAQVIAALAYGTATVPECDVIVGPGNKWVTAAKQVVSSKVKIDMLAGPTELVIIADESSDSQLIAANLLAQAEHDEDALPLLISLSENVLLDVNEQLELQLASLSTANIARVAIGRGFSVVVPDLATAAKLSDRIAPEHLQLAICDSQKAALSFRNYGAMFIGQDTPEVLGDYGAGPNHVLPTGGTARFTGGLSVMTFLCMRTWLRMEDKTKGDELGKDAASLAKLEGLHAHSNAARLFSK